MSLRRLLRTPGRARTVLLRRLAALLLLCLGSLAALSVALARDPSAVVIARPVKAGTVLTAEDVTTRAIPPPLLPDVALRQVSDATGQRVVTALEPGEILTPHKLLAAKELTPGERLVPVRLADPDIIGVLHHGDVVTVVTTGSRTVAAGARVVLAAPRTKDAAETLLVALPFQMAEAVAAAGLSEPLTVVISG